MDTNTLLILIIGLLTCNLLFVGVYIVLVLKEVRKSIKQLNVILENVAEVSESVSRPLIGVSSAVTGIVEGFNLFQKLRSLGSRDALEGKEVSNEQ